MLGYKPKLSQGDVIEILATPRTVTNVELGRRYGVSREAIRKIRQGTLYARFNEHVPTTGEVRYCSGCKFFDAGTGCGMGFPDFEEIGPVFANECEAFMTV